MSDRQIWSVAIECRFLPVALPPRVHEHRRLRAVTGGLTLLNSNNSIERKRKPKAAINRRISNWPVIAVIALLCGCGQHVPPAAEPTDQTSQVVTSQVERGPVRMTVRFDPSPARLSDEPRLTLEIASAQGITVHKPEFGSALGEFIIRDFREPLPRVDGDRQVLQQIYTLEPTRAGKFVIDPISISFLDNQPGGSGKEHTLQSEPITVEVAAAVAQDAPSLDQLHGPADPLTLPEPSGTATWWIAAAATVALLGAAAAWWLRRRKRLRAGAVLTPAELANLELQRLQASNLAARDVKLFYVELTAIVRRFVERAKGVHAPEQTTQEFLQEISRRKDFPAAQSRRLGSFLEAADLVKFAAHQPREEDVEESFRRANAFVGCADGEEAAA